MVYHSHFCKHLSPEEQKAAQAKLRAEVRKKRRVLHAEDDALGGEYSKSGVDMDVSPSPLVIRNLKAQFGNQTKTANLSIAYHTKIFRLRDGKHASENNDEELRGLHSEDIEEVEFSIGEDIEGGINMDIPSPTVSQADHHRKTPATFSNESTKRRKVEFSIDNTDEPEISEYSEESEESEGFEGLESSEEGDPAEEEREVRRGGRELPRGVRGNL